jgi:DNA gyrase subunit A
MCIRFLEEDVNEVGRTARGVKGIDLKPGDYVVSMDLVRDREDILVVTENGFGKKTSINEYRVQSRAGKGIVTSKVTKKTGDLIGIKTVSEDDEVMIVSSDGIIIRLEVKDISRMGRNTQGVTLMKLNDENRVVAIALVEHNGE